MAHNGEKLSCLAAWLFSAAAFAFSPQQSMAESINAAPSLSSREWLIKTWQTENGLPENSASAIAQSPDGYLWFGTFYGLVRFDGVKFTVLNRTGDPKVSLTRSGPPDPAIDAAVLSAQNHLQRWADQFKWLPVVKLGVSYAF